MSSVGDAVVSVVVHPALPACLYHPVMYHHVWWSGASHCPGVHRRQQLACVVLLSPIVLRELVCV